MLQHANSTHTNGKPGTSAQRVEPLAATASCPACANANTAAKNAWPIPSWVPKKAATDCNDPAVRLERTILRDNGRCVYCGLDLICDTERLLSAEIDHLVPQEVFRNAATPGYTKTGNYRTNLVLCCGPCNDAKGNWPLSLPNEAERSAILSLGTRKEFFEKARSYTVTRRRSHEAKVAALMAKAWCQRASQTAKPTAKPSPPQK